ncbi:MAG: type II toxin-antitoxin system Phd/YefM family antitoxin [Lachnospiraceae bacterium]|nr:type II toxin-antitoxin system Phd/YefM family antitoxin [Lachnospiraceae bacterium]
MIQIRPVSDLRNKFPDIEKIVNEGEPVYLTKNGYGAMVVLSLDLYSQLIDRVEIALDEADLAAKTDDNRMTHAEIFSNIRRNINDK